MTSKLLIFAPRLDLPGGVANFYRMLKPYFSEQIVFLLKSKGKTLPAKLFFTTLAPVRIFFYLLFHRKIETVLLNPSLGSTAVARDMISAFIVTNIFHRNLAIFWHGWDLRYEKEVEQSKLPAFRKTFFKARKMFVLSSSFRNKLLEWGYQGEVILATTCFENCLLNQVSRHPTVKNEVNLLFLSRVEETKGIFIVLDTLSLLQKSNPEIRYSLCIAGDGTAMQKARDYAAKLKLQDVEFTGYLRGDEKYKILGQSDIFFFPTYYGEGMPCALLEAMGAGLYIVTRMDGGIPDIFEQDKMGFITDSKDPAVFADAIGKIVKKHPDFDFTNQYNREYAENHFSASNVAALLLKELSSIAKKRETAAMEIPKKYVEH